MRMQAMVGYRPDIDGLRAVAVLSVLLYHINKQWLPGGYVGVDIFFVISGFLITRNIWNEIRAGQFSLKNFYLRRIRRIAPASLVVTIATLFAGGLLLQPEDMARLARSAIWSALSAANIFYWKYLDTDYFAETSDQAPLLHMWSLGVEEQFYLLWPALLIVLALAGKRRLMLVAAAAIGIGAFVVAELTNVDAPKFSYFMLPARAGELMMGAVLALAWRHSRPGETVTPGWLGELLALCGFGLLAFSLWKLDDASPFPGINALYPCLGATLLILAGQMRSGLVNALLTFRPLVFIGLVSFSLYLWHWPILAFIRYFYGAVSSMHAAIAVVVMLLLSIASYRWVEQPARRMRGRAWIQMATLLVIPLLAVVLGGTLIIHTDGLKSIVEGGAQYRIAAEQLRRQTAPVGKESYPCQTSRPTPEMLAGKGCVVGGNASTSPPGIVLWGDSNAGHYIGVLQGVAARGGFSFRYLAVHTCPPVFGEGDFGASYSRKGCQRARDGFQRAQAAMPANVVVLAGQWSVHDHRSLGFSRALRRTIAELRHRGSKVVLLAQVPTFSNYDRECETRWTRLGGADCAQQAEIPDSGQTTVNLRMKRLAAESGAAFLDVRDQLCQNGYCSPYLEGRPVYANTSHLSMEGSSLIGQVLARSDNYASWLAALQFDNGRVLAGGTNATDDAMRRSATPATGSALSLPAGYTPSFVYSVRSQRHWPDGHGKYRHIVILEYLDATDAVKLGRAIASGLAAGGLEVKGPMHRGSSILYVARGNGVYLTADIRPDPDGIEVKAAGAKGTVQIGWKDSHPD